MHFIKSHGQQKSKIMPRVVRMGVNLGCSQIPNTIVLSNILLSQQLIICICLMTQNAWKVNVFGFWPINEWSSLELRIFCCPRSY